MVFESVVTDVLNKILGDYVENLDSKQLKIGIWGGDVVLHNLKLRENALDDLDLPVQLVYGYLGKLVLKIPWKNLYSQPVVAQIEDLYILISPKQSVAYDAEKEEKYELQTKQVALQALDEAHQKELDKNKPKPDASFTEKLTAQIVNNLQVTIARVHIRYEDTTTTGLPFSLGVTLSELEICTTDQNWEKCYLAEQVSRVYKIANLDSLCAYMNCTGELFSEYNENELSRVFKSNIAQKNVLPENYCYILAPISSIAKLQLNMNPEYDDPPFQIPKIDLFLEMDKLNIGITSTQFQNVLKLADSMNRMQLGAPYRKYRPYNIPYKGHSKEWWKFAITAVLEEQIRKKNRAWTWENMKNHRELCITYAEAYKEKQLSKKPTATLIETCTFIEQKLDLFNLILIRQRIQFEVDKIKETESKTVKKAGWFSWLSSSKKETEDEPDNIAKKFEAAMTEEEREKLYEAIGYHENAAPLDLPKDYEAIKMNFKLISLEIGLYDDSQERKSYNLNALQTIMLLQFSMTTCDIQQRPAASALSVTAGVKEMKLIGLSKKGFLPPTIIESKITDELNLLDIFFETNPLDGNCDQRVKVRARPLQIVYDSETVLRLVKVFSPQQSVNLSELEGAASVRMANFKERSSTGLQYMIDSHSIIEVDIQFMPNILILPGTGTYMPGATSVVVVSLGKLQVVSQPHHKSFIDQHDRASISRNESEIFHDVMERAYDKYNISIEDIQVLVATPKENWEEVLENAIPSEMHVLRPTSILVDASVCVVDDDPRMPKTKVEILLPAISLNITEDRIFEALEVGLSIPLPESEEPAPAPLKRSISRASLTSSRLSLPMLLNQERKKAKPAPQSSISEVVQYTSLELNFALKEIQITLYKSCHKDGDCTVRVESEESKNRESLDSNEFGTPEEELPVDEPHKKSLIENDVPDSLKIISLQILQLEAQVAQRTYETVASVKLGAIHLKQHDQCDEKEEHLAIIDTPRYNQEQEYLLTISYVMASKISPEFKTKYNCTEQLVEVNFSTLNVILHQECLLHLMQIASTLQTRLDEMNAGKKGPKDHMATADTEGIVHKLAAIVEEHEDGEALITPTVATTQTEGRKRRQAKVVDCIKFSVLAKLEQVGLMLTCRKRPLASLKIEDFNAGVILKTSYTELNLSLKNILVTDLNPNTIHTSILSIVGTNAFNSQVVMYNLDETSNYNSDDMKITVEIGCMKIVFLNWFVTSVMSFLNNFQAAQEALANASAAAADAARQNALDAYEKATRMRLNIRVKAPLIIVPMDSESSNGIALDLGFLVLSNTTTEIPVPEKDNMAIVDDIKLELKDMKMAKVATLDESYGSDKNISLIGSIDTPDRAYSVISNVNILNPVSFILNVKRNLSSSWYKEIPEIDLSGRLKSIEFNLFMEDYGVIMSILNRNLNEGVNEFPPPPAVKQQPPSTPKQISTPVSAAISQKRFPPTDRKLNRPLNATSNTSPSKTANSTKPSGATTPVAPHKPKIYEKLKFNFQFDGIIANLLLSDTESLARFGLYFLSLKGTQLVNGTLSTAIVLCDIQIDDTRSNTKSKITKYLCRKDWKGVQHKDPIDKRGACQTDRNFMVDVTAIIKENDTFAEVRVCGFDLILCIDFLLKLANFFTLPEDSQPIKPAPVPAVPQKATAIEKKITSTSKLVPKSSSALPSAAPSGDANKTQVESKINLMLHIEEPDIILVESLEDINTHAIVFNMQAQLNYRALGEKQLINGQIDALKMYMCAFMPERREATRHYILHPCVISLQGSTPEEEGLHISLKMSEIILNVSPATIELLNKAMQTISSESADQANLQKNELDFSQIWKPHKFKDTEYWFIKVDQAQDALQALISNDVVPVRHEKTERCVLEVPCITLVIETGVGYYTTPMLVIDTRLNAVASDWSRNLKVKGSLTLSMNYYNQALAVWEPIIELNEHPKPNGEKDLLPWELNFKLDIESKKNEFDEESEDKTTSIVINSDENMELTLSKTCLDLLSVLGAAFSQAIEAEGLAKPEVIAPYLVENDTGFDITLNFKHGIFTLHECHMPNATTTNTLNRSLVFQTDEVDADLKPDQVKNCTISPGGHVYLQTKDLSTITSEEDEEYNVYVKVGDIDKEIILPVTKSDKRFFPLMRDTHQDPWGVLSEVNSEFGTTRLNIHGVVKVKNHFTNTIKIYRNQGRHTDKLLVGEVAPGETYHVPLHAIYAESKELYFALDGYNVSIQGIKWNDCPTDLDYKRNLQCDPIDTYEPLYILAIREKTEVFYEHTNKFKLLSVYYTIHLKPPLYLRNALPIAIKVSVAGCSVRQNGLNDSDTRISDARKTVKEDMLDYGEKEVDPGDVLHLPTVRLASKSKEHKSYLVVRLLQYLEKDWSCTTEIFEEHENLDTWNFSSYDSAAKMDMNLCVRYEKRGGSDMLTLYSPFWMINKTGLMLSYKTDTETVDILYHPPEYNGPILFSFREKLFFDKKCATIRIDNGEWSEKIPLDVAGSTGGVTCKANDQIYQIGVHNHLTHNSLTKQITFIPFYIATNKCEFAIELQEQSRPGDPWIKVEPNAFVPIWPKNDSDHMIVTRVDGLCAVAFNYSEVQCTLLRLEGNKSGGMNVDVQTTEGGVYITFTQYNPGDAPGLLINHTSKPIVYYEKGRNYVEYTIKPHNEVLYTWLDPAGEKTLVFGQNKVETDLRRDDVGEILLTKDSAAYWVSFLDGLQRVILFTEEEAIATRSECSTLLQHITQSIEVRIHGIGLSLLNNETGVDILYLGITSSGIIWESRKETKKRFKQMNMHDTAQLEAHYQQYLLDKIVKAQKTYMLDNKFQIDFDRMLLFKTGERILQRTFYPGVWISMNSSPFQTQLHAKINNIQLDNQLADCIFPVVLAPIAPPKSVATTTALKPFVECSMVQRLVPNSTVKQFKYASMLIQEFHFKVDLLFLTALSEMFSGTVSDEQAAVLFNQDVESIQKPLSSLVETQSMQEQKNFYDNLHLGPLKIHVSFSMAGSDISALPGLLSTLVQGVGVTLTDVNDVVFRLAFFERQYQFFTQRQLTSEITAHYTGQALKQLYVLVLGLDVLGNPYGLVVGLKKGVEDLFYEPFQGAIQGPGEFAEGLVLGVKSLFGHTVGGAAGAVSKITGAMGKGLAALTFDEDYQKKRRQQMNKKPTTFHKGIAHSSKGLVMGFVDGVTGVVTKPVSGAKEEGVEGFFKGLGKGAIGLVTRPTAGVVDFASGSFEAVKRATESGEEAKRLRPPRFIHHDNVLRPYSLEDARGNKLLKEIEKGKYASTDTFVHAEDIVVKQEVFLVSNHRIIYACKNSIFGNWTVQWTYLWHEIASVAATDRGVDITLKKKEDKKVLGLFSSHDAQHKVLPVAQVERRQRLAEIMESQRNET